MPDKLALLMGAGQRRLISRTQSAIVVEIEAYRIWQRKIWLRRSRDWYDAHDAFVLHLIEPIFSHDPRHARVTTKAEELYRERKAADALEDWVEAERLVATTPIYSLAY